MGLRNFFISKCVLIITDRWDFVFQYEQTEKKRREEREAKERSRMMEKEGGGPPSLRREMWYHPNNGQRVSRTTSSTLRADQSDTEEELSKLSSVDVSKMKDR